MDMVLLLGQLLSDLKRKKGKFKSYLEHNANVKGDESNAVFKVYFKTRQGKTRESQREREVEERKGKRRK